MCCGLDYILVATYLPGNAMPCQIFVQFCHSLCHNRKIFHESVLLGKQILIAAASMPGISYQYFFGKFASYPSALPLSKVMWGTPLCTPSIHSHVGNTPAHPTLLHFLYPRSCGEHSSASHPHYNHPCL